jgi:myo-inositol 2-dehydrogenase / D-chiro-inositol 1-dehydrogenase
MRIGLLGAGRIGAFHAATLLESPDVTELVIGDVDTARAGALADKLGESARGGDVDGVFAAAPDAVVITTATASHAELVVRSAAAGLPVFCEKPIALDVAGTRLALDRVAAAGTLLQVGFQRRFDPAYGTARAAVAAGELGELFTVRMTGLDRDPPPETYLPTSGGIFRDLHIHDFDILRWVTGGEVVEAFAYGAGRTSPAYAANGDYDTAAAVLRMADGTLVTVVGGRSNPPGYDIRMELAGSAGMLAVGLDDRSPLRSPAPGLAWPAGAPYAGFLDRFAGAYTAELRAFLDVARGRVPNPCDGAEALAALYVAEAAQRSADEHRPVTLAEVSA